MSIDAPLGDDDDNNSMVDIMASGEDCRTDRLADMESMSFDLRNTLRLVLKDREREILCCSFGIGCPEMGLEEIGEKFGLSRERAHQIREKAIHKLRESKQCRILTGYLAN